MTATTQHYRTNLNCGNCVAKVRPFLDADRTIHSWTVDTSTAEKRLTIVGDNVPRSVVEAAIESGGFRVLGPILELTTIDMPIRLPPPPAPPSFLTTYKPVLLLFGMLISATLLAEFQHGAFHWHRAMTRFMGGFFLAFSYFKLLNIAAFADAFAGYDL
ncbi:MAG: heavy-metal-associated domain-containing protein, partial [Gemmataceae bacterium]